MNVVHVVSEHNVINMLRISTFEQHDEEINLKDMTEVTNKIARQRTSDQGDDKRVD